jgi:hypothetical protein
MRGFNNPIDTVINTLIKLINTPMQDVHPETGDRVVALHSPP